MSEQVSYTDFFERHSFGEVPLYTYSEFIPVESDEGIFKLRSSGVSEGDFLGFLVPSNYWEERLGEAVWRTFDFLKQALISGSLVEGCVHKKEGIFYIESKRKVSGNVIFSKSWSAAGIRHVDFVERAVPIPEDETGFHDYIRRWRERELKDRGLVREEMDAEIYNTQFMRINGPIRYHFFLYEDAEREPECYFAQGKVRMPSGFPVFEDLRAEKLELLTQEEYWAPVWLDPEYPYENSIWVWVEKKDGRMKSRLVLINRSGRITLMLVPFYFSFIL